MCAVSRDGLRKRKTGPSFPLQVMICKPHGHFTVYPLGFTPYGRTAVAPVGFSGEVLADKLPATPASQWRNSIFEAPVAMGGGPTWRRELGQADPLQRRHSETVARVFGLSPDIDSITTERIRGVLDLAGLDHEQARRDFSTARNSALRAVALLPLLAAVVLDASVCARVLSAGYLAGVWGRPLLFDVRTATVFPAPGTAPTAAAEKSAASPHESVPRPPGDPPNL